MATQVFFPAGPTFVADAPAGGSEVSTSPTGEAVWVAGVTVGRSAYEAMDTTVTVLAGVPLTVDLLSKTALGGGLFSALAGRLVYLELTQLSGIADLVLRRSAATPIAILSGVVDTFPILGSVQLVNVQPSTTVLVSDGLPLAAATKAFDLETATGAVVRIRAVCV